MQITLTFDIDEKERVAIAADQADWDRLDVAPARRRDVETWLESAVRAALTQLLETYEAGGMDKETSR